MEFRRFALYFKQDFEGGYRYLDRCGEFLVRAQDGLQLIPSGDQTPSGGRLEAPELGIKVEVNTVLLRASQEFPGDDTDTFLRYITELSTLYRQLFNPNAIEKNGVAVNTFIPFSEVSQAEAASLKWGEKYHETMARSVGMVASARAAEYTFKSGSRILDVKIQPATVEKMTTVQRNAGAQATSRQKEVIRRQNLGIKRILKTDLSHALFVNLDLKESSPPADGIPGLFNDLLEKEAQTLKQLCPALS